MTKKLSTRLTVSIWDRASSKYSGTTLLLLLRLAALTRPEGFADPSIRYLAARCACTERAAQKVLRKLEQDGVLRTERMRGMHGTNRYFLQEAEIAKLPHCDPAQDIAQRYVDALTKKQIAVAEDWKSTWPDAINSLLSRGLSPEQIREAATWGFKHALPLACDPPSLAANFDKLIEMKAAKEGEQQQ